MTILSCRTGLTSLSEDSLALFVVEVSQFEAFRAAEARHSNNGSKPTALPPSRADISVCLMKAGRSAVLW